MARSSNREANVAFKILGADQSKQDIGKVRTAMEGLGDSGKKAAQSLVSPLENIQREFDKLERKIGQGKTVTARDVGAMSQQYSFLQEAIERSFGSLERAPAEIQAAFQKATAQINGATKVVREATDAAADHRVQLNQAGAAWQGFGGNIDLAFPKLGKAAGIVGALSAALGAGVAAGTAFAKAIGTSFEATESAARNLKTSLASITNALVTDGFTAAWQQARAAVKTAGDTITGSGRQIEGFNAIVSAGVDRAKALKVETDDLGKVADAHRRAVEGGAEALKLFNKTIAQTDPQNLAAALDGLTDKFRLLAAAQRGQNELAGNLKKAVDDTVEALTKEIAKLDEEREKRRLGLDLIERDLRERQVHMEALRRAADATEAAAKESNYLNKAFGDELLQLQRLLPNYEANQGAVAAFSDELRKDVAIHENELTPARAKELRALADKLDKYGELDIVERGQIQIQVEQFARMSAATEATNTRAIAIDKTTRSASNLTGEEKKLNDELRESAKHNANLIRDGKKLGDEAFPSVASAAQKAVEQVAAYRRELADVETKTRSLLGLNRELVKSFQDVSAAAAKAAGKDINWSFTGTPPPPQPTTTVPQSAANPRA